MKDEEILSKTPLNTGVLLMNLGSPDAPTANGVKRFLTAFLSDPKVIDLPRFWWIPLLRLIIIPKRAATKAKAYQTIWDPEDLTQMGSPLIYHSERLRAQLTEQLQQPIVLAMTYGTPSIRDALNSLAKQGCRKVIVLPLFPQYSSTTTGAAFNALFRVLKDRFQIPELHLISDYFDHPDYIKALTNAIFSHWTQHSPAQHLLCSFHGLPARYSSMEDPYEQQCKTTFELLKKELYSAPYLANNREEDQDKRAKPPISLCYQSRFGKEEWLTPYTDQEIIALAKKGVKTIDIICPGFSCDCLETLEEVMIKYQELFIEHGGKSLRYIPCLNSHMDQVLLLQKLIQTA